MEDGVAFDGSSVRGFQAINESDMALLADSATAVLDPFRKHKTLNINFFVHDPITGEPYSRDPRNIARKAEEYLAASGVADTALRRPRPSSTSSTRSASGPTRTRRSTTSTRSRAGGTPAATSTGGNLGYKVNYKGGYFPVPPVDHYADLRDDMVTNMTAMGFEVEREHHEVGTAGQAEINYKFNTLLHAADELMLFKYIVKNTAWQHGKTATFMPKPLFGDNGSGMHVHQSLWKDGQPLFHDESGYGGLSDTGPLLHRRPAPPRAEPAGVHQPHGELLPPPGAGLRGAGQPGLLGAQPLGLHPHPALGQQPEGQAHRVPLPRLLGQPVPGVLRAC